MRWTVPVHHAGDVVGPLRGVETTHASPVMREEQLCVFGYLTGLFVSCQRPEVSAAIRQRLPRNRSLTAEPRQDGEFVRAFPKSWI